jgi:type I restriction enzyme S subunit
VTVLTPVKTVPLHTVATIERDVVDPAQIQKGTLYVGLEHMDSDGHFIGVPTVNEGELASSKFAFSSKHVLYGKLRPYLAKIARPDFSGVCSTDILPILPGRTLDRDFLCHFLRQPKMVELAASRATGANLPRLSPKTLAEFPVPLPPLPEQRRIAAILDKADALRAKRRTALEQLNSVTQAMFVEMFGVLLANVSEYAVPLRDCAEVVSGVTKGRTFNGRATVEVPYLRVANVQAGFLDLSEVKTIPALPDEVEALRLMPGDVVLTEGGDFDKLGRGAVWTGQIENCIHQNHVFRVRFNRSVLPEYFHQYVQTVPARAYFLRCAKKTTNLASINMTQLRALPVVVPDVEHQREFVRGARAVSHLGDAMDASLRASVTLFASLQKQAFAGELWRGATSPSFKRSG